MAVLSGTQNVVEIIIRRRENIVVHTVVLGAVVVRCRVVVEVVVEDQ